jgi:hypothetical protein
MSDLPALDYRLVSDERTMRRLTRGAVRTLGGTSLVLAPSFLVLALLVWALDPVLAAFAALIACFSLATLALTMVQLRSWVREGYAPGTVATARYDSVIRLADGAREQQIPYPMLLSVRQVGDLVVFRVREAQPFVLPVELCPPLAQQRVAMGIASGWAPQPELAGFGIERRLDADAARAVVDAALQASLRQPSTAFAAVFAVAAVTLAFLTGGPVWGSVLTLVVLILLTVPTLLARARGVRALTGEVVRSRFDAEQFTLYERGVITRRPYADARSFRVMGAVAILRFRGTPAPEVLPAELFPPEVRGRFSAASAPVS